LFCFNIVIVDIDAPPAGPFAPKIPTAPPAPSEFTTNTPVQSQPLTHTKPAVAPRLAKPSKTAGKPTVVIGERRAVGGSYRGVGTSFSFFSSVHIIIETRSSEVTEVHSTIYVTYCFVILF